MQNTNISISYESCERAGWMRKGEGSLYPQAEQEKHIGWELERHVQRRTMRENEGKQK